MPALKAKDILKGDGFFVGMTHSAVSGLFLELINSTNTRHQSIKNIHQHPLTVDFQLASKYPKPQFSFSGQSLVGSFHS
jgi:hypothetical protein